MDRSLNCFFYEYIIYRRALCNTIVEIIKESTAFHASTTLMTLAMSSIHHWPLDYAIQVFTTQHVENPVRTLTESFSRIKIYYSRQCLIYQNVLSQPPNN